MGMSEKHRKRRQQYLGASEMAAVLGINPWKNGLDIYLEKVGQVEPFEGNAATDRGQRLERAVLDWAADELGVKIKANQWRVHENKVHSATLDAIILDRPTEAMEAKTTRGGDWGTPGSDEVPEHVLVQCQHQCLVADLETVWVPVLTGGLDFALYRVDRNDKLIEIIKEKGERFWNEHVVPRIPPADLAPSMETLKRLRREPETIVPIPDEIAEALLEAEAETKAAKEREEAARARLMEALGTAEAAQFRRGVFTYLEQERTSVDNKRLRAERPEIFAEYSKTTTFRVLRKKLQELEQVAV